MKLYSEEQVKELLYRVKIITAENMHEHINHLTNGIIPIELPSDEEMANASNHCKDGQVKVGFLRGVLWYQEQILNQNK